VTVRVHTATIFATLFKGQKQ